ncbi:hypothetical protein ES707_07098 [subsurface metagenome]
MTLIFCLLASDRKPQSFGSLSKTTKATSASWALSKPPERKNSLHFFSPGIISETFFCSALYRKTKGRLLFPLLATPKANASLPLVKTTGKKSTFFITLLNSGLSASSACHCSPSLLKASCISLGSNLE